MSVCRGARDLTFQYPCSCRFPPLREGNPIGSVPPACRGNLKEGVRNFAYFRTPSRRPLRVFENGVDFYPH
jgi:hypothetical protein